MPLRRKISDHEDARACLAAAEASGMPRAEWARAHGVNARSLNAWRITLQRGARRPQPTPLRLVELVPTRASVPETTRYLIRCGELAVEVDERFDDAVLRRLLAVVSSC